MAIGSDLNATRRRSHLEREAMPTIPTTYLKIVDPLVNQARSLVEQGKTLQPLAFVGNLTTRQMLAVSMSADSVQVKDAGAQRIRDAARQHDADFVVIVMEAWSLPLKKIQQVDEIVERFGSIGASPYRIDVVSFSLETGYGIWVAQVPLRPKAGAKKKRTFAKSEFRLFTNTDGRFATLLLDTRHGRRFVPRFGPGTLGYAALFARSTPSSRYYLCSAAPHWLG